MEGTQEKTLSGDIKRLVNRLRRRIAFLGAARTFGILLLGALALFGLDYTFTPPVAVRIILLLGYAGISAWFLLYFLVFPLRKKITPADLALAIEKNFPELRQEIISALQFEESGVASSESRAMAEKLIEKARSSYDKIPVHQIFRPGSGVFSSMLVLVLAFITILLVILAPETAAVWAARMAGMNVRYPRSTFLHVVLPAPGPTLKVEGNEILAARGTDVPVGVRVEGRIPDSVWLVDGDGTEHLTAPKEERLFRFTYRSVSRPFSFHAKGGDDPEGDRTIEVKVVDAPAVSSIKAYISPPKYTGLETKVQEGGPVEGLLGSTVSLEITSTQPVKKAELLFDSGISSSFEIKGGNILSAGFTITGNDRYRLKLVGIHGLRNVRPGSYPVLAVKDSPPRIKRFSPLGTKMPLTVKGVIPLRVEVTDNFGVSSVDIRVSSMSRGESRKANLWKGKGKRKIAIVKLVPLKDLFPPREGDTLKFRVSALDNAKPRPSETLSPEINIDIVVPGELLRTASDKLRRLKKDVERALRSQKDLLERQREISFSLSRSGITPELRSEALAIQGSEASLASLAKRLDKAFSSTFDLYLFGGVMPELQAEVLQDRYALHYRTMANQVYIDPSFYISLKKLKDTGEINIPPGPARILDMVSSSFSLEKKVFPGIRKNLSRLLSSNSSSEGMNFSKDTEKLQGQAMEILKKIKLWLEEWSEFDDVVQMVRDIMEAQKKLYIKTLETKRRK